jgi:hypothetical protein
VGVYKAGAFKEKATKASGQSNFICACGEARAKSSIRAKRRYDLDCDSENHKIIQNDIVCDAGVNHFLFCFF